MEQKLYTQEKMDGNVKKLMTVANLQLNTMDIKEMNIMTNNETPTEGIDTSDIGSRYRTMTVKTSDGNEIEIQLYGR